jgi:hypothetical protein
VKQTDGVHIARIGNNGGHGFQLVEFAGHFDTKF